MTKRYCVRVSRVSNRFRWLNDEYTDVSRAIFVLVITELFPAVPWKFY